MNPQRLTLVGVLVIAIATATVAQSLLAAPTPVDRTVSAATAGANRPAASSVVAPSPTAGERPLQGGFAPNRPTALATTGAAQTATALPPTKTPTPVPPTATPRPTGPTRTGKAPAPQVSARNISIVDEASGDVLYSKNEDARVAPASCTKIGTAIVAIERGDPKHVVKVQFDSTELVDSTLMYVRNGEEVTLEDLLYGLMLPSGNDAALAIAGEIAGSKQGFVDLMNAKVRELGLANTQFKNPHGLDQTGHYSSAYDMVMLARYGMTRQPLFAQLAKARSWEIQRARTWQVYNLNKLLGTYRGADGVKIGYTDEAGKTMVASATRDGHRVYVGLMGSTDLWADSAPLLDWAFSNFTWP